MRMLPALAPLALLAACGGGDAGNTTATAPAGSVEAVAPPAGQQWVDIVERTAEGGFRMGNPDAPVKVVEFASRTCPACAQFSAMSKDQVRTYVATGKVSFEYRDFVRNGADLAGALLVQCAGTGPYFALTEQMFAEQAATLDRLQALPESFYAGMEGMTPGQQAARMAEGAGYIDFVKARGVSEAQARECLADANAGEALSKATAAAVEQYNVPGTPSFLVNGTLVNGSGWPALEEAIKAAGA